MVSPLPSWMLILSIDFVPREQAGEKNLKKISKTHSISLSFIYITGLIFYISKIISSCLYRAEDHVKTIILLVKILDAM